MAKAVTSNVAQHIPNVASEAIRTRLIRFHCSIGQLVGANLITAVGWSSKDGPCCAGHDVIIPHVATRQHSPNTIIY